MATHSSVLAWRIPGTGEPGGLPCARLGHSIQLPSPGDTHWTAHTPHTIHVAPPTRLHLEFPREIGLILRRAGKSGNPFQTKQGNRPSFRRDGGAWWAAVYGVAKSRTRLSVRLFVTPWTAAHQASLSSAISWSCSCRFPCFVWKGFPDFPARLRMRPVSLSRV